MAPHHSKIENNYLDLPSIRRIIHDIHQPALVVGAGQGLIVAELLRKGIQCDGVDLSSEMIRCAKIRRGLNLIQADACAMPFGKGTYRTVIYATGVIDFMMDEEQIRVILEEARRIVADSGNISDVLRYQLNSLKHLAIATLCAFNGETLQYCHEHLTCTNCPQAGFLRPLQTK
jgi:ubiquinone/menaquinone biosynthesis C-methylase UbiE